MLFDYFIRTYGYLAVFLGTLLEGETVLIAAGLLAYSGYLVFSAVIFCAFLASVLSDNILFIIGRLLGKKYISRFPFLSGKIEKAQKFIEEHATSVILGFRFVYRLRTVTPLAVGASNISAHKFTLLNIISSGLFAAVFGMAGYMLGMCLTFIFGNYIQIGVTLGILFIGLLRFIFRLLKG
jgi:membrane protein DedA with SNARE-associated domain